MGRKSNLRKKFAKLKLRQESEEKLAVQVSPGKENNAASRSEEFGDDRFSCLPEKIISNILSRLEASEAVRTGVLSKSWVNKWTSITELDCFDAFQFPKLHFLDGLETVIPKVSCMKQFSLNCFYMHNPSRLESLISSALKCYPLEALTVSMVSSPCCFYLCIFNTDSLTKLELNGKLSLTLPAAVCFTHLKSLRLFGGVNLLINLQESSSGKVILQMPVLEKLELIKCKFWNVENLEIVAPSLSKLAVLGCTYLTSSGLLNYCVVEISGGSNMDFSYAGSFCEDFVIRYPSNVSTSTMKLYLPVESNYSQQFLEEVASNARLFLDKFHTSLKMLAISQNVVAVLSNTGPSHPLPVFVRLKHVKIPMLWCFTCPDLMNNVAVEVLMNAPFLEELTISAVAFCKRCKKGKRKESKQRRGNIGGTLEILPAAGNFMVHLKRVIFESFNRWVDEVELVRIFLAHAPVLEEVSIPVNCMAVARKLEKHFSAFPKASANSSVVFRVHV